MLKNISNLGKALSRAKQKEVFGGRKLEISGGCLSECHSNSDCNDPNKSCEPFQHCGGPGFNFAFRCTCI